MASSLKVTGIFRECVCVNFVFNLKKERNKIDANEGHLPLYVCCSHPLSIAHSSSKPIDFDIVYTVFRSHSLLSFTVSYANEKASQKRSHVN